MKIRVDDRGSTNDICKNKKAPSNEDNDRILGVPYNRVTGERKGNKSYQVGVIPTTQKNTT
jgi:hypothetical protein